MVRAMRRGETEPASEAASWFDTYAPTTEAPASTAVTPASTSAGRPTPPTTTPPTTRRGPTTPSAPVWSAADLAAVTAAYQQYLGRAPDAGGLAAHRGNLGGAAAVIEEIKNSDEARYYQSTQAGAYTGTGGVAVGLDPWFTANPYPDGGTWEQRQAWLEEARNHAGPTFTPTPEAGTTAPTTPAPSGWDAAKWADPTHTTTKYVVGRVLDKYAPDTAGWSAAIQELQTLYPGLVVYGHDTIDFGEGSGPIDVRQNAAGGGTGWQWLPASEGMGTLGTLSTYGGTGTTATTTPYTYGTGTNRTGQVVTGPDTTTTTTTSPTAADYAAWIDAYRNPATSTTGGTTTGTTSTGTTTNPSYWQDVSTGFGGLLEPWNVQFSYPAFSYEAYAPPAAFTPPTMAEVQAEPGYQMRLTEGQKALERSAAARGTLLTGGTLKSLDDYAQAMAANEYQNVYGRRANEWSTNYNKSLTDWTTNYNKAAQEYTQAYNKALGEYGQAYNIYEGNVTRPYNFLSGLAGLGQSSANQLSSTGLGYAGLTSNTLSGLASNVGNLTTGAGNATAAGQVGSANAWNAALSNLSKLWSDYAATQSGYGATTS